MDRRKTTIRDLVATPTSAILMIVAVASAAVAIISPLNQLSQGSAAATVNLTQKATQVALNAVPGLGDGAFLQAAVDDQLTVVLHASSAPVYLQLLTDLGTSIWAAAIAVIAYLLARILYDISRQRPFNERNPRRLVWISIAIIVGSLGADTINWVNAALLTDYLQVSGPIDVVAYYSLTPLVVAAICFTIASAFRTGAAYEADLDGVI